MKTNFKKLALVAATTAAAAGSMSAQAVIMGVPGEGVLVPFVTSAPAGDGLGESGFDDYQVDTVVRFSLPQSIGSDVVINNFTAPHIVSNTYYTQTQPGLAATNNLIHWVVFDAQSNHLLNATIPLTPGDVAIWTASGANITPVTLNGNIQNQSGFAGPGYLVATTEDAAYGLNAADFAFSADAFLVLSNLADASVIRDVANIPVLPLADGADTQGEVPSTANNVIQRSGYNWLVSPISSGIRTSGANPLRVVDVALASTTENAIGSYVVLWNDRNATDYPTGVNPVFGANIWDTAENKCSTPFSMPQEVNTYLIGSGVTNGTVAFGVDGLRPVTCAPATNTQIGGVQGSGKLELILNSPVGTSLAGSGSSMMAFSIPVTVNGTELVDLYGTTILPLDRGSFSN